MKHGVTLFKSAEVALKELEPYIRNGEHLQTGKPFEAFGGLRSRELLANWLLCTVINHLAGETRLTFTTDPNGSDGMLYESATERGWPMEHILVPRQAHTADQSLDDCILEAVEKKRQKGGAAYASGKVLVVFLNAGSHDPWHPNKLARNLPTPLHFEEVWVLGLEGVEDGEYLYNVAQLDVSEGAVPAFRVRIRANFTTWVVTRIPT